MSAPRNAKTAALEALIEAHAIELKLPTVRRRFRALAAEAVREQQTPVAYLAALLDAKHQERAERREKRRLIDAAWCRAGSTGSKTSESAHATRGVNGHRFLPSGCSVALRWAAPANLDLRPSSVRPFPPVRQGSGVNLTS